MLTKVTNAENNSQLFLFVLFYIGESLFTISSQYISDIQPFINNTAALPKTPRCIKGIYNSFGRIVTVIDLEQLLKLHSNTVLQNIGKKFEPADSKTLIILKGEPLNGLITTQIHAVEKPEIFHTNYSAMGKNAFLTDFVRNVYANNITGQPVIELDIPKIICCLD